MKHFILVVFLLLGACHCQTYTSCDKIETQKMPNVEELVKIAPLDFYWGTDSRAKCGQRLFAFRKQDLNDYTGNSMIISPYVFLAFKFIYSPDNMTATLYPCFGSDPSFILKIAKYESNEKGAWLCGFTCDGAKLDLFYCYANTGNFVKEMDDFVQSLKSVPRVNNILPMREDCPSNTNCPFL